LSHASSAFCSGYLRWSLTTGTWLEGRFFSTEKLWQKHFWSKLKTRIRDKMPK
jgi:hypothetical protein